MARNVPKAESTRHTRKAGQLGTDRHADCARCRRRRRAGLRGARRGDPINRVGRTEGAGPGRGRGFAVPAQATPLHAGVQASLRQDARARSPRSAAGWRDSWEARRWGGASPDPRICRSWLAPAKARPKLCLQCRGLRERGARFRQRALAQAHAHAAQADR